MIKVGLREANQHFSRYIKMLKNGDEIILTERGKPVAVIKPLRQEEDTEEKKIKQLEQQGILKHAEKERITLHRLITIPGKSLAQTLSEGREERI